MTTATAQVMYVVCFNDPIRWCVTSWHVWVLDKMADSVVKCLYNGTEYSFVCKDPAQIEDLKCPICLELVYEPVLTSCGHLFCQRCVRKLTKCPTCRDELQCKRNQRDERRVKGLKVKCPNWEKGCRWKGELGYTAQHRGASCQMETVSCPRGCRENIARGHLKEHGKTCTQRTCKCSFCQFEDTFIKVTRIHFTVCEEFCLNCPAKCGKLQSRKRWLNTLLSVQKNSFHASMLQLDVMK